MAAWFFWVTHSCIICSGLFNHLHFLRGMFPIFLIISIINRSVMIYIHYIEYLFSSGLRSLSENSSELPLASAPTQSLFGGIVIFEVRLNTHSLKAPSLNDCLDKHLYVWIGPAGGLWSSHSFCSLWSFVFAGAKNLLVSLTEQAPSTFLLPALHSLAWNFRSCRPHPGRWHSFS